ncbi:MAG: bifunctional nuclease family protein [Planctomycetaceae bacterium]|nr:bifunctional nuclease family protein [Planctomycetaceae bacterium]
MFVQMKLSRIVFSEINNQQVIYLREVEGIREFYILIGVFEASCIDRRVKGIPQQRPLTHDLVCHVCNELGGKMQDILISRLEDQTYFAQIRIQQGEKLVEIDARPSDAIAIAVSCRPLLPILVKEEVLRQSLLSQQP